MKRLALLFLASWVGLGCSILTRGRCGDGILNQAQNEACDDGNEISGDGCDQGCSLIEGGFICPNPGEPCEVNAVCGNGAVEGTEECDDGDQVNTNACKNDCTLPVCGDGVISNGEGCDDSNTTNGDGCDDQCQLESCGDSVVQAPEDCDDGNQSNNDDCLNTCVAAACGDGFTFDQAGGAEECDDGNANNNDSCLGTCVAAVCGDNVIFNQGGGTEECDNGANNSDNTPNACRTDCQNPSCGDNVTDTGEECDDGAGNSDNTPDACRTDCSDPICGDNVTDTGEECDDGGTAPGDGCDQNCQFENVPIDCNATVGALETAINNAAPADTILVSGTCDTNDISNVTINKDLTIVGQGGATINATGDIFTISGSGVVVTIEGLNIRTDTGADAVVVNTGGSLALVNLQITNINAGGGARAITCDSNLLLDRVSIRDNRGDVALELVGNCNAVVVNSIFVNNQDQDAIRGANGSDITIAFSTFFNNINDRGVLECGGGSSSCIIDSITASDVGADPVSGENTFVRSFVENETGGGSFDPALDSNSFIFTAGGVANQGNTNPGAITLPFNVGATFPGINLFDHDFDGDPRGATPDPGAFEQ